mmetsp:Transcript_5751/g.24237  ORF Transcript_5751/g.24237 Transcript_5751/m.24237 type:complete len:142 (-) Transcript_5751:65-490(-)
MSTTLVQSSTLASKLGTLNHLNPPFAKIAFFDDALRHAEELVFSMLDKVRALSSKRSQADLWGKHVANDPSTTRKFSSVGRSSLTAQESQKPGSPPSSKKRQKAKLTIPNVYQAHLGKTKSEQAPIARKRKETHEQILQIA